MNRRSFCTIAGGFVASLALSTACRRSQAGLPSEGRITARPGDTRNSNRDLSVGEPIKLGLDRERDALLFIPKSATNSSITKAPLPLLLFLHGATQSADDMFWYLDSVPEEAGVAILAPNSRKTSWDAISDSFGPDVEFLNRALQRAFDSVAIDSTRVGIGGFSDGATYAIALGLINGDLFKRVAAFSPGLVIEGAKQGKPSFFISHGAQDRILPIERCGRRVAAGLKARGYEVTFREFDGGHGIPPDVMREGLRWVAEPAGSVP